MRAGSYQNSYIKTLCQRIHLYIIIRHSNLYLRITNIYIYMCVCVCVYIQGRTMVIASDSRSVCTQRMVYDSWTDNGMVIVINKQYKRSSMTLHQL